MAHLAVDKFTIGGARVPPIPVWGAPGSVWPPTLGYLRLEGVGRGTAGATLRVLGLATYANFEARLVVASVPGAWATISAAPWLAVSAAEGVPYVFDIRCTWLARAPRLEISDYVPLRLVASSGAGY
jgi:hypothetical protein